MYAHGHIGPRTPTESAADYRASGTARLTSDAAQHARHEEGGRGFAPHTVVIWSLACQYSYTCQVNHMSDSVVCPHHCPRRTTQRRLGDPNRVLS